MIGTDAKFDAPLTGTVDWFVEQFGLLSEQTGMPRTGARIFALLIVAGTPVSFNDIVAQAQVSRAGVSTNTRLLEEWRAIERVTLPGRRETFYRVRPDIWLRLTERQILHYSAIRDVAARLLSSNDDVPDAVQTSLTTLGEMLDETIAQMRDSVARRTP